jgi:uncharacterized repeat protein (TIGR01451 family)
MRFKQVWLAVIVWITGVVADPYPLYIRFLPYNPPNLHLNQQRATNAYYLPSLNQGVTYNFTQPALTAPLKLASGSVPMRLMVYRFPAGCSGAHTITIRLRLNMGGTFTTVSTVTQTINVPTFGGIVPGFNINGLTLPQQYQLQAGDYVQVQITATAGGLCLVNEYPIGGTDTDATHIVLQTAPSLTISKSSAVVSDPVNGTNNPKRIPGAVIRYSIGVANAANASGTAESVTFTDPIPNNLTYLPSTIVVDGTAQTDAVDADSASFQSNSVNVSLGNIAPGVSHTIRFDATIN